MTFGQKVKKLRTDANITQKELAEKLNVTFQTVSKWESDINEPDFANVRELSKILNCSIEYLLSDDEDSSVELQEDLVEIEEPAKKIIDYCRNCGKGICEGELIHNVERKSEAGIKEIVCICDSCFKKKEEYITKRAKDIENSKKPKPVPQNEKMGVFQKIANRKDKKPLIWALVIGAIAFVISLIVCIVNHDSLGWALTIILPIAIGYSLIADIYCIFTYSYISEVFGNILSWTVKFPGLIFTWDIEGFIWVISMKILFAILGFIISICVAIIAFAVATFLSIFSFIPILVYNKKHYEGD